ADNIWIRASDGDLERVKHLVEVEGIAPDAGDSFGYTPVHAAASHGHPELLDYLLKKGANPNVPDNDGDRPLHYCETEEAAQMLIAAGADPTITNGDG
ncbi:ankyrin, partial [Ramicandelaber brevisporus]